MSCWKWTAGCLIVSFIVFGLPCIILYRVVNPRDPTFTVDHASVSSFNLTSDGHLTSLLNISLRAHNRNHLIKLRYSRIRVSIFKDKQNLGTRYFPKFTQRKRNVTILRVRPVSVNVALNKAPAFNFAVESGMGYITFDIFMTADLNAHNLEVNCKGVTVDVLTAHFTPNMTRSSSSRGCRVKTLSKHYS